MALTAQLTERAPGVISDFNDRYDGCRSPHSTNTRRAVRFSTIGLRGSGEKLPGYALHEASVGVEKDHWRASLYGKNLFNKFVFTGVGRDPSYLQTINGFELRDYVHSVLRPREIGLELRVTF